MLGYPISDEFTEASGVDAGQSYQVQYFERDLLEYHPEYAGTAFEVLAALVGRYHCLGQPVATPTATAAPIPTDTPTGTASPTDTATAHPTPVPPGPAPPGPRRRRRPRHPAPRPRRPARTRPPRP